MSVYLLKLFFFIEFVVVILLRGFGPAVEGSCDFVVHYHCGALEGFSILWNNVYINICVNSNHCHGNLVRDFVLWFMSIFIGT